MTELYFRLGSPKGFTAIDLADKKEGYAVPIRELLQNSLDASREAKHDSCKINIYLKDIPQNDIPHITEYKKVLKKAIKTQDKLHSYNANAERVVKTIQDALAKNRVRVLMFVDDGLGMPPDRMSAILSGNTVHGSENTGGAFGVGNLSSYSLSSLRYVLYATKYKDGSGNSKSLFTGSPVLAGHNDGRADRENRGRIVAQKPHPEDGPVFTYTDEFPEFIEEAMAGITTGTMVAILGLNEEWSEDAEYAMVSNFFHAIVHESLQINIHNNGKSQRIDRDEVIKLIERRKEKRRAMGDDILSGKMVHQAWSAVATGTPTGITLSTGDKVYVYIEDSGSDSAIVMIRNGMLIARHDSMLSTAMDHLRKHADYEPFTAVIDVDQTDAPKLFRMVKGAEGPYHNKLERAQLPPDELGELRELLKELSDKISKHLTKKDRSRFISQLFKETAFETGATRWQPTPPSIARPRIFDDDDDDDDDDSDDQTNPVDPRPKPDVVLRDLRSKNAVRYTDHDDKFAVHLQVSPSEVDAKDEVWLSICLSEDSDHKTTGIALEFINITLNGDDIKIDSNAKYRVKLGRMSPGSRYNIEAEIKKPVGASGIDKMQVALLPVLGLRRDPPKKSAPRSIEASND